MTLTDAARILGREVLAPPDCGWWSKATETRYEQERARLEREYIAAHADEIDEWCRNRFEDELDSEADAELDRSKEAGAL